MFMVPVGGTSQRLEESVFSRASGLEVAIAKVEKELSIDFLRIISSKPSLRGLGQEVVEHALP